ncbi:MAG: glycosyltransferase family 2 protein [Proteobacteria bacterium]|nr:glycosyltransferase family 2 protein [Pseudomonadota bacterium]
MNTPVSQRFAPGSFRLSCVVPAYNEASLIGDFLPQLVAAVRDLTADVEIVVVNDGSRDATGDIVTQLSAQLPIHYIELSRNFGKEVALQAGLDATTGDCVVLLDADFQHPVAVIALMVERWQAGIEMVYTTKADRDSEPALRRLGSRLFYWLVGSRRGVDIPTDAGDFRLLDRCVVDALCALPERNRFMKGLYGWVGFRSEGIAITMDARPTGESKFNPMSLAALAATGITAFSVKPLRMVTLAGLAVSVVSILMAVWIVIEKLLFGQVIPGFATLAAAVFFLSGVQLISLGIVGEYVGRIFEEVKQRPRYLISRESGPGARPLRPGNTPPSL